jgi:hypothetical protein
MGDIALVEDDYYYCITVAEFGHKFLAIDGNS